MVYSTKEKAAEYRRGWRARNLERSRLREAVYREKTRDELRARDARYRITNKENRRISAKKYSATLAGKVASKRASLKKRYGITLEQYDELLAKQHNRCAICGRHQAGLRVSLAVDHNHSTGKLRGLLCDMCNRGMGLLRESTDLLVKAINYLKENG